MKRSLVLILSLFAFVAFADPDSDIGGGDWRNDLPQDDLIIGEETVFVDNVFIPKGFDAKDNIEIIATGWKPSPCYGTPKALIEKVGNDIKITLKASKRVGRDRICIEMAQHFQVTIPINPVPAGIYNVIVNPNTDVPHFSHMEVALPANNSIDDFLYADVEQVSVDPLTRTVTLRGENSSPCLELDRLVSTSNGLNTYAIMPIMRKKDAICPQVLTPFSYKYDLPNDLHASKILVHVRTIDGKSRNKVFSTSH